MFLELKEGAPDLKELEQLLEDEIADYLRSQYPVHG